MRRPLLRADALLLALLLCAATTGSLAQTAGGTRGTPGRPPTKGPESGLSGVLGKGPTTRPGSHESSTKDERDRLAGKFPAPKEKGNGEDERRDAAAASATAYVDAVALEGEGERQAITLMRDDFRVAIDGTPRTVVSIHYVFRGPQALLAGRSIAVGAGVVAHADEARTIVILVDEASFAAGVEKTITPAVEHVLDVVGPVDRAAVLTLPQPQPLRFAASRSDLLASVRGIIGRASTPPGPPDPSLDALTRVMKDLAKIEGPKSIVLVEAGRDATARRVSENVDAQAARESAILDAAAASRSVIHIVTAGEAHADGAENAYLHTLARSTGGTVTRLTGAPRDLAPLAAVLLGGYLLEVRASATDRDGKAHALVVTTTVRGVRVLAARRWMPRFDALPAPVMRARP